MRHGVLVLVILTYFHEGKSQVTDKQYALMPELFYMDNFDQCMLHGDEALYCFFTYELKPTTDNNVIWNIIQNVSSKPENYNHTKLRHGLCVPTSCSRDYAASGSEVEAIQNCYSRKLALLGLTGNVSALDCQTNTSRYPVDIYDWAAGGVFVLYISFLIFASLYEKIVLRRSIQKSKTTGGRILEAFSIFKNWKRLTSISENSDHKKLRIIQGLRFYTMFCVIMSHTLMATFGGPIANTQYTENVTKKSLNMLVAQGYYIVQTFFIISAFLFSYQFFNVKSHHKEIKSSFFFYAAFLRYIRITPTLFVVWAIHSTWNVHFSTGPLWDAAVGKEYRNCRQNGWTNFLFINNYVNTKEMCLRQTWFLAADMQLFLAGLVVLFIINKYPKSIYYIFGVILTTGFVLPGIVAYVKDHDILYRQYPEILYDFNCLKMPIYSDLVISTHTNMFGFFLGMLFGYLFFQYKDQDLRQHKILVVLWWILTFGLCLSTIFVAGIFYDPNFKYTALDSAVYWACGKNLFALGMCIAVLGLTHRIGWFVLWLMDNDIVQILGRLTFSCYLIHVLFIQMKLGFVRYPISANDTMLFIEVIGDVGVSYVAGLVLCLVIEMPISAIQKMFLSNTPKPKISANKYIKAVDLNKQDVRQEEAASTKI
ncbi:nose resistant to fluoxetine protein 6-like [Sitophilus oryzae]|uniref:Nose resistant to fluoxetine protein 6-like n=1 Tax=Sitophilus oryzae TaxID=7048 RepID=A0A6J2YRT8_SITOR|nr:nose resistant to fluoxetine protein 6-like [Sitophilus oryzae]